MLEDAHGMRDEAPEAMLVEARERQALDDREEQSHAERGAAAEPVPSETSAELGMTGAQRLEQLAMADEAAGAHAFWVAPIADDDGRHADAVEIAFGQRHPEVPVLIRIVQPPPSGRLEHGAAHHRRPRNLVEVPDRPRVEAARGRSDELEFAEEGDIPPRRGR